MDGLARIANPRQWQPYGIVEPFLWLINNIAEEQTVKLPLWRKLFPKYRPITLPKNNPNYSIFPSDDSSILNKGITSNQAGQIFISYSRSDFISYVQPLVDKLQSANHKIWIDQSEIQGGYDWLDAINGALKSSDIMILCVSPSALRSTYVKMEYRHFIDSGKVIIPIICKEAELPIELQRIQHLHYSQLDELITLLNNQ